MWAIGAHPIGRIGPLVFDLETILFQGASLQTIGIWSLLWGSESVNVIHNRVNSSEAIVKSLVEFPKSDDEEKVIDPSLKMDNWSIESVTNSNDKLSLCIASWISPSNMMGVKIA